MGEKEKSYAGSYAKLPEEKKEAALIAATALYAHSIHWRIAEEDKFAGPFAQNSYAEEMAKLPISLRKEKDLREVMNKKLQVPQDMQDAVLDILDSQPDIPRTIVLQQIRRIEGEPVLRGYVIAADDKGGVKLEKDNNQSAGEKKFIERMERIENRLGIAPQDIEKDKALVESGGQQKGERQIEKEITQMLKGIIETYQRLPSKEVGKVLDQQSGVEGIAAVIPERMKSNPEAAHILAFDSGQLPAPKTFVPGHAHERDGGIGTPA